MRPDGIRMNHFIDSNNTDYVMGQIRKKYISDSTVNIVLIGTCTHIRRYVDWEIKSSLRQGEDLLPNGLLGIVLPGLSKAPNLPERFAANFSSSSDCYAHYHWAPTDAAPLRAWIEDAHASRTSKAHLISNSRDIWKYNHKCEVCDVTH